MTGGKRQGNRPDRRIADRSFLQDAEKTRLLNDLVYVGSSLHKLRPGDYGLVPPSNPRPSKSACDEVRSILISEAALLFRRGLEKGMVSVFPQGGMPKYVWAVDDGGEVYEAKTKPGQESRYHGYRIGEDEQPWREYVLRAWRER
ncbi:hypothetical protein [Rhodospirillum rubrum]|uniref:Uncharacterized protein n=1 Tax=Rhodospirillum rubrum (strain ATCC 11170 / ATH 1.1.1 / DSM 467 / LMG 4362 / NCIMB 8255 / S1) TaxID=269796 RepID=Q2RSQ1_RHORT|nr:hypothetical protein [Rhodospirillum rubrum]ABC22844.1 hypothetical protein Rru_A2044 [Rhodospirillum rubrum ATCC 11170]AEO48568.1 hypothetical protein F11_10510 [Rhodospirillum rubrum F11]MBK5954451.1 hypothetical protein [Rhodospirillum rubrum]QXG78833.1 hypothetical protein KUL73_10570 [Rhodospirillum rubrum]HAP99730.1 hypothetical protein [Rhodospirillum rubrum]